MRKTECIQTKQRWICALRYWKPIGGYWLYNVFKVKIGIGKRQSRLDNLS